MNTGREMTEKICSKCNQSKTLSNFYKHHRHGHDAWCIDCRKAYSKLYQKQPKWLAYRRNYYKLAKHQRYIEEYLQRPKVKKRRAELDKKYYLQHPQKNSARNHTSNLVRDGKIARQPCESCGAKRAEAHHWDYSNPDLISWLCSLCHKGVHRGVLCINTQ